MELTIRFKILSLLFFIFIFSINFVYAQNSNDIISDIKIEGNQRVELDTIYSYLKVSKGENFDIDKLNNSFIKGVIKMTEIFIKRRDIHTI